MKGVSLPSCLLNSLQTEYSSYLSMLQALLLFVFLPALLHADEGSCSEEVYQNYLDLYPVKYGSDRDAYVEL